MIATSETRKRARSVLIIGGLTAIATSAPAPYHREAHRTAAPVGVGQVLHFTVRASEATHRFAETFLITVSAGSRLHTGTVRVVPDDDRFETATLAVAHDPSACLGCEGQSDAGFLAGDAAVPAATQLGRAHFDIAEEHCPPTGDCTFGVTVEVLASSPADAAPHIQIDVDAAARRNADPALLCADDRDFPNGATIEVTRDDE